MIVVEVPKAEEAGAHGAEPAQRAELLCITQPDHAHLSGELAALWRLGGLAEHPRRRDLLFACREHDNGWREADAAPRLDRHRDRPHDFRSLPREDRIEVWRRGIDRYARERPYAALLIAQHARTLHRDHRSDPGFEDFFEMLEPRREELLEATGADEDLLTLDYEYLAVTDLASLAACNRWTEPFSTPVAREEITGRWSPGRKASSPGKGGGEPGGVLDGGVLSLDPFPLAGSTTFRVACRRIPKRSYSGDADLAVELATARWGELVVKVRPEG